MARMEQRRQDRQTKYEQILSEAPTVPYSGEINSVDGLTTTTAHVAAKVDDLLEERSQTSADSDAEFEKRRRVVFVCTLCFGGSSDTRLEDQHGPVTENSDPSMVTCRLCSKNSIAMLALKEAKLKPISRRQFEICDAASDILVNTLLEDPTTLSTRPALYVTPDEIAKAVDAPCK